MRTLILGLFLAATALFALPESAEARLTTAQRRELSTVRRDLTRVRTMLRKDEITEAEEAVDEAIAKVKEIAEAAMVDETDPTVAGVIKLINTQREAILKAKATSDNEEFKISFESDIAPILKTSCGNCHGSGNRTQGNLNLMTWSGIAAGGQSRRPIIAAGDPARSILYQRLVTPNDQARMPRGMERLETEQLEKIALWITQGAKFDGKDKDAEIGSSGTAVTAVDVPMPTGNETVSFSEDIAPWFSNLCMRCHGGANGRGGFSMANFNDLMKGGDSGRVILPGNPEGSRLYRLVGGLDQPRMPQGQAQITRKNFDDLRTWIIEGAKFDGDSAATPLRNLVPSDAEKMATEFAKLTDEEFLEYRKKRTDELWDKALEKTRPGWAEGEEVYVFGNVSEARLTEAAEWAEAQASALRKVFGVKSDDTLWKGKLTIFVMGDRFSFDEFVLVNTGRRAPRTMNGMTRVTDTGSDAYVVLEDIGDDDTGTAASLRVSVLDYMTGAFLERNGGSLPEWVKRGTGLAVAASTSDDDPYIAGLRGKAKDLVASLNKPEDVFADGTFAPGTAGPVGFTLVEFMIENGGGAKFSAFLGELQKGRDTAAAMRTVYKANLADVAAAYVAAVRKGR